jgi:hypothetical protein
MAKRVRRTKEQIEASKGLGDTIEKITTATGIKALVKFIAGDDCKCDERKEKLNKLFPYKKLSCLVEEEYNFLTNFFEVKHREAINPSEQIKFLTIYNRVFGVKEEPTQCGSCWREFIGNMQKVYNEYEN